MPDGRRRSPHGGRASVSESPQVFAVGASAPILSRIEHVLAYQACYRDGHPGLRGTSLEGRRGPVPGPVAPYPPSLPCPVQTPVTVETAEPYIGISLEFLEMGQRNHEENETHFHLKTKIMTMRRTAVHPRRGGLKLYFSLHYATSR